MGILQSELLFSVSVHLVNEYFYRVNSGKLPVFGYYPAHARGDGIRRVAAGRQHHALNKHFKRKRVTRFYIGYGRIRCKERKLVPGCENDVRLAVFQRYYRSQYLCGACRIYFLLSNGRITLPEA